MEIKENCFPILVLEQEGQFHCIVSELSLFESGKNLTQVYDRIQKKKKHLCHEFKELHLETLLLSKKEEMDVKKKKWNQTAINYLLLGFFLMVPILTITHSISIFLTKAARIIPMNPVEGVIHLGRCLKAMPKEKKIELKEAAQLILAELDQLTEPIPRTENDPY